MFFAARQGSDDLHHRATRALFCDRLRSVCEQAVSTPIRFESSASARAATGQNFADEPR